jgi:hypothetical protein
MLFQFVSNNLKPLLLENVREWNRDALYTSYASKIFGQTIPDSSEVNLAQVGQSESIQGDTVVKITSFQLTTDVSTPGSARITDIMPWYSAQTTSGSLYSPDSSCCAQASSPTRARASSRYPQTVYPTPSTSGRCHARWEASSRRTW